jgi:predicted N-acetyltransferase YhbS
MVRIRPETIQDYAAIAALHARAFGERPAEALIVALLRQRPIFDPELSLVAEQDGQVLGHALFTPHTVRLLGQDVRAVNLAPIAVDPSAQRQGIGGRLIAAGHALARDKGYAFCFLLGHTSYYPRHGYLTRAYGASSLSLPTTGLPEPSLLARAPREADIAALCALWRRAEAAVDFALDPGGELLDWLSPNPAIAATVFLDGQVLAGYARVHAAELARPRVFLAHDATTARRMAAHLATQAQTSEVILPLHPASAGAAELGGAECRVWDAAMVCPLQPSLFEQYYAELMAGKRAPGRVIWPTAFDLE